MIVAGTGHRPDKLYLGYSDEGLKILVKLAVIYLKSSPEPIDAVISGLALGWDTALALAAVKLKIPLIAAIPFEGQEKMWKESDVIRWQKLKEYAQLTGKVHIVCKGGYSPAKMQTRNKWMVDNCHEVVSLWDGSPGGTKNCINYAEGKKKIKNLWEEYHLLVYLHKLGKLWHKKN